MSASWASGLVTEATNHRSRGIEAVNITPAAIREQLQRILQSPDFPGRGRAGNFLRFIVQEALDGRAEQLKGYTIATAVFNRDASFDPQLDPVVRVEAGRLRLALGRYYLAAGRFDPLLIQVPKGAYIPEFSVNPGFQASPWPPFQPLPLTKAPASGFAKPSLAVVRMDGHAPEGHEAPCEDAFTEQLIVELTRFQELAVIEARAPAPGQPASKLQAVQLGRELGVDFVLRGSVQKDAERVTITVRLADAASGAQLWAETYCRGSQVSASAIYSKVAQQVAANIADIHGVIPLKIAKDSRCKPATDLTAYEAVLRYHEYIFAPTRARFSRAREALDQATAKEPECATAWAALSSLYWTCKALGMDEIDDYRGKAYEMARRAVFTDPMCQQAHWAMALAFFHYRDKSSLLRELEHVLEINPNAARSVGAAGWLMALAGEWERGLTILDKAIALNRRHPGWFHFAHFQNHLRKGEFEAALAAAMSMNMPDVAFDTMLRAIALAY